LYLGCQDKSFTVDDEKIPFPELPFIAAYFVDWVLSSRHKGAWRFNPSDMYGNPRKPFEAARPQSQEIESHKDWTPPAKSKWLIHTNYLYFAILLFLSLYLGVPLFK
jgi:hypothetical protein